MKYLITILSLLILTHVDARNYYVSTTGNDANAGDFATPFRNWQKLNEVGMQPGDTAFIRGGTYRTTGNAATSNHLTWSNINGNFANRIVIMNYPGETPIFNLDNIVPTYPDPTILQVQNCSYLTIKGLTFTGLVQIPSGAGVSRGINIYQSTFCRFDQVSLGNIGGYGYILDNGANDNVFYNCDAYKMGDPYSTDGGAWGNANGFQCTGGSNATRNTFDGCRAWWISDDGFDMYGVNGVFTFKNCWSFWNGYEPGTFTKRGDGRGFKLGPNKSGSPQHTTLLRTLIRCFAFKNASVGFDQNNGDMKYAVYNCTSFDNPEYGFMWDYIAPAPTQDFKNNLSYMDGTVRRGAETDGVTNSWDLSPAPNSSYFQSLSSVGADGPRQADGSLPDIPLMKLKSSCPYIEAGTIIPGVPYSGTKPDIGAFEYDTTITPPPPPVYIFGFEWIKSSSFKGGVNIKWKGIPTPTSKQFQLQRANKNKEVAFVTIATIAPLQGQSEYAYADRLKKKGTYYYRVKHIDANNKITTSEKIKFNFTGGTSYPTQLF